MSHGRLSGKLCHFSRPVSPPARLRRTFDEETDERIVALVNGPRLKLSVMKLGRDLLSTEGRRGAWKTGSGACRNRGDLLSGVPLAGLLVSSNTRPLPLRNGRPDEQ